MKTYVPPRNSPGGNKSSVFSNIDFDARSDDSTLPAMTRYFEVPLDTWIRGFMENIGEKRVLDVGCGLGTNMVQSLLSLGLDPDNLYSVDPDNRNFSDLQNPYPRPNYFVGEARHHPYGSDFDLVVSSFVLPDNQKLWLGKNFKRFMKGLSGSLKEAGAYLAYEPFDEFGAEFKNHPQASPMKTPAAMISDPRWLNDAGFSSVEKIILDHPNPDKNYLSLFYKN